MPAGLPLQRRLFAEEEEGKWKRRRCPNMDFKGVKAALGRCAIHPYPAMMHFGVARQLIETFSTEDALVFDPFVGSGVTAVESVRHGRRFIGCDINPLAILICRARLTTSSCSAVAERLKKVRQIFLGCSPHIPPVTNLNYWFKEEVVEALGRLREAIQAVEPELRPLFHCAFSETVRRVSNTRWNEFKLLRIRNLEERNIDVWETFSNTVARYAACIEKDPLPSSPQVRLLCADVAERLPDAAESVDLVITSPPYGDSRTTVAYGQFSRLSAQWLGIYADVDKLGLGGSDSDQNQHSLPLPLLQQILNEIACRNPKRANDVRRFYNDYIRALSLIAASVKKGGYACFVVGNRRVCGIEIPNDALTAIILEHFGFQHEVTLVRAISNKRMPSENSPSNIKGEKESTMLYEYLVICRRR